MRRRKVGTFLSFTGRGVSERKPEVFEATTAATVDRAAIPLRCTGRAQPQLRRAETSSRSLLLRILRSAAGSVYGAHARQLQLELRGSVIFC